LRVRPHEAFALEDSPNGLKAARAAGIACGVTRSAYFATARFDAAAWVRDDLDAVPPVTLASIRAALPGG
jgi:beta-phosphoglucomutase-like phosphatase (HAD superfamily)